MPTTIGIVIDPLETLRVNKDSTIAMMLAAQRRGWQVRVMELGDLMLRDARTYGRSCRIEVRDQPQDWYRLDDEQIAPLDELSAVLMRKDPPFDMEYIQATYLLERAEQRGCLIVNRPQALRDANEKLFATEFVDYCPAHRVTRQPQELRDFLDQHQDIILKPLDGMGGQSIFRVRAGDPNTAVIIETITHHGQRFCMAQRFIPEIADGDKRLLIVGGEPVEYVLARIPAPGESRGNLAAGARAETRLLTAREREIVATVGKVLMQRGILFAGLDIIGDWLTEINITSPTCIREIDRERGTDIADQLMSVIARQLHLTSE